MNYNAWGVDMSKMTANAGEINVVFSVVGGVPSEEKCFASVVKAAEYYKKLCAEVYDEDNWEEQDVADSLDHVFWWVLEVDYGE